MANNTSKPNDPKPDNRDIVEKTMDGLTDKFNQIVKQGQIPKALLQNDFFRAVKANRTAEVLKMLDGGTDPNSYNASGQTALHIAALNNATDVARLLIERGADPRLGKRDKAEHTPLEDAVTFNKPEMVELLARHGGYAPGLMVDGWSLLHRSCQKGKHQIVEALLKAGADCNEKTGNGSTPLLIAVVNGHAELVETLLKFPAVIESMNDCFVSTDAKERTAFQLAVDREQLELAALMLQKGAAVNRPDAEGRTPLLSAIESGNSALVRLLVESGADINKPCGPDGAALTYACKTSEISDDAVRVEIIDLLISLGADTDVAAADGAAPLHSLLAASRPPEVLSALLRYPVDPDVRHTDDARTPLIEAAKNNSLAGVQALLQAGANPKLIDGHGKSALSYARANGRQDIIDALEQALLKKPVRKPEGGHHAQ